MSDFLAKALKMRARFQKYYDFFCANCGVLFDFGRIRKGRLMRCPRCHCYHIVKIDLRTGNPTRMDTIGSQLFLEKKPRLQNQARLDNEWE